MGFSLKGLMNALPGSTPKLKVTHEELTQARRAHREWHLTLVACLTGRSNEVLHPEEVCFDDRCVFGQWLLTMGEERLGREGYAELTRHHKMVHLHAADVLRFRLEGQMVKARALFKTAYADASRSLLATLTDMEAHCSSSGGLFRKPSKPDSRDEDVLTT